MSDETDDPFPYLWRGARVAHPCDGAVFAPRPDGKDIQRRARERALGTDHDGTGMNTQTAEEHA